MIEDYLASVDDDVATSLARGMGYRGYSRIEEQEPIRLPEFGPRKIHSTLEVEPDPLMEDGAALTFDNLMGMFHRISAGYSSAHVGFIDWYFYGAQRRQPKERKPGNRIRPPRNKPQWEQKFHERRPTEPQKVGRPKRRR